MDSVMFGRPILMFRCEFRPCRPPGRHGLIDSDNFTCNLVFFSAFERLSLPSESENPMQAEAGIPMLYEPGSWDPDNDRSKKPILHVGYVEHILCRAPLIPCFLDGNDTNTIPASKRSEAARHFPFGKCDSSAGAGDGSKVYEVNMPMWRFGRGKERSMSVSDAEKKRAERLAAARRQGAETKRRRREAALRR